MPKNKYWKDNESGFYYKVNYLDDILDLSRFKNRKFKDFKELLSLKTEREAKKKAKDVFTDFLELMVDDLIESNDIFVLPIINMGYLKITNTANPERSDYRLEKTSSGKIYTPRLKLDKRITWKNKKYYKVRFNQKIRMRMFELITNGHKY